VIRKPRLGMPGGAWYLWRKVSDQLDCQVVPLLIPSSVAKVADIIDAMRRSPGSVRYVDLFKVCATYFGEPRQSGTSHAIFKTPWPGDPRVNIQNAKGKAKLYQVRQVLLALKRMDETDEIGAKHQAEKPK